MSTDTSKDRNKEARREALVNELLCIISKGDYPLVQAFTEKHKNNIKHVINRSISDGDTALIHAARFSRVKIADLLLRHGADVNAKNSNDYTPLLFASWRGREKLVIMFLKHGADIHAKTKKNHDAVSFATRFKHNHILSVLSCARKYGTATLPEVDASREPSYDIRQLSLVENVRIRDETKKAVQKNDLETAKKNLSLYEGLADYQGDPLWNPLILSAARRGLTSMVSLLIDMGENINGYHHGCFYAFSPFSVALKNKHFDVCALLIVRGAVTIEKELDLIEALKSEKSAGAKQLRDVLIARKVLSVLS